MEHNYNYTLLFIFLYILYILYLLYIIIIHILTGLLLYYKKLRPFLIVLYTPPREQSVVCSVVQFPKRSEFFYRQKTTFNKINELQEPVRLLPFLYALSN